MIQRIQTVYMALVVIFSFVALISTMGEWTIANDTVANFSNFTFNANGAWLSLDATSGPWCMGILLILVIFLSSISILLFRKRMRQLRLVILSTILLVGYIATYALFAYYYHLNIEQIAVENAIPTFHVKFAAVLPALSIILNCLAIQGIRKDEALVRSLDRLR